MLIAYQAQSIDAEIAQLVEHFTRNEGVVGSSPIFSLKKSRKSGLFYLLNIQHQNQNILVNYFEKGYKIVAFFVRHYLELNESL